MARIPPLYPILDHACFVCERDSILAITRFAGELLRAGATLIQFRDKSADMRRMLSCARELRRITESRAALIVNDRLDICLAAGADGVHMGQDDVSPVAARKIFDSVTSRPFSQSLERTQILRERMERPLRGGLEAENHSKRLLIGFSTHNLQQVERADTMPIDYLAVGPVFATSSKANPDPVVGLEGIRRARGATAKPLVAIGGITRKNCREVMDAGADAVAVISDLLESPVKAVEEFLRVLG